MEQQDVMDAVTRAIRSAREGWARAHHGMPSNPMTRAAAIPAIGTIAASMMNRPEEDEEALTEMAARAVAIAKLAWEHSGERGAAGPMARTAEKTAVGIIAAGILSYHPHAVEEVCSS
jgi:hypothetical protein